MLTSPIFSAYSSLSIWQTPLNITAGMIFDIVNGFILVLVFTFIYDGIRGKGWKKGLNYGIIVGLFRVLMSTFSSIVMYNIPLILNITTLITGFVEVLLLCITLSIVYERL